VEICLDLHLSLLYIIMLNKLGNVIGTVCIKDSRGVEGTLGSVCDEYNAVG